MHRKDDETTGRPARKNRELLACEARLRTIMTKSPYGILVVNAGGVILFANPAAAAILDGTEAELPGRRFELPVEPGKTIEAQIHGRDGKPVVVELWGEETAWDSEKASLVCLTDVTERKRNEQELRKLYHAVQESPSIVLITDASGAIEFVNPKFTAVTGYTLDEVIGRNPRILKSGKVPPGVHRELWETVLAGREWRGEMINRKKNGELYWEFAAISPIKDADGKITHFIAVTEEITERKRTEEALRFSEARYRALYRDNPTMIFTIDPEWNIISVNPFCASQLGYTADELEGRSVLKMFHEDDRSAVAEQLRMCLQNPDRVYRWQFRKVRKDGKLLWVEEIAQAVYDLNGALNIMVVCQDITERRRAEEELRRSEERHRRLYNETPVMLHSIDQEGRLVSVSNYWLETLGYERSEVIGRRTTEFLTEASRRYAEEVVLPRFFRTGSCVDVPYQVVKKTGDILDVLLSAIAERDSEGKVVRSLAVMTDVTERKRAEEALRKSEKKFLKVFHAVPALLGITTLAEGRFIDVNETCMRILGYRREEIIGRTSLELGIWGSTVDRDRAIRALEEKGAVRDLEINLRAKNGEILAGLLSAEFIDIDGEQYILSMINDVTERKRAQGEVEKLNTDLAARAVELEIANREMETFSYSVSHDLRKPLTVINGYCQIIQELCGASMDEQCLGYLQEINDGTQSMNDLIDALLKFSCVTRSELHRKTVDLSGMANTVAAELALTDPERRVAFRIAEGITADGDAHLLRVVLENLLGNAWKYTATREEAVIEFGVAGVNGQTACFVRDNGTGFDMADAEKLFIPFQRLAGADAFKGHGVGLATVQRIIQRHGGRIWAEGEPGKGATFYFTL